MTCEWYLRKNPSDFQANKVWVNISKDWHFGRIWLALSTFLVWFAPKMVCNRIECFRWVFCVSGKSFSMCINELDTTEIFNRYTCCKACWVFILVLVKSYLCIICADVNYLCSFFFSSNNYRLFMSYFIWLHAI